MTGHKKSLQSLITGGFSGGSGGIRTHEPLRTTAFRVISNIVKLAEHERK